MKTVPEEHDESQEEQCLEHPPAGCERITKEILRKVRAETVAESSSDKDMSMEVGNSFHNKGNFDNDSRYHVSGFGDFSSSYCHVNSANDTSSCQHDMQKISEKNIIDLIISEFPAPTSGPVFEDTIMVPCVPVEPLYGLAFLSSAAYTEYKCNCRKNVLLTEDEIELPLWYAKQLYAERKVRLKFPEAYKHCKCLAADYESLQVGLLSPFFFEAGSYLASVVSEEDWPISNIDELLTSAELKRWNFIIRFDEKIPMKTTFFAGLTWRERTLYNELVRIHEANRISQERRPLGGFGDIVLR